jgi:hypothetical protein
MLGLKQSLMQAAANVHFPPKAVFPNICDLEVHRMALSGGKGRIRSEWPLLIRSSRKHAPEGLEGNFLVALCKSFHADRA